jgi:predicted dehydrogenase
MVDVVKPPSFTNGSAMTKNTKLRFGVLGAGSIGVRHARYLLQQGHRVDVYDPNFDPKTNMDQAALLVNGARIRVSAEELLGNDGLLICTPTPLHTEGIVFAGTSTPLFVEKPIFDITTIITSDVLSDYKIMMGYNLRFHPLVTWASAWLPKLGDPLWATFYSCQLNKKYTDHVVLNWSHEIDLMGHFFGEIDLLASHHTENLAQLACQDSDSSAPIFVHLDYLSEPPYRTTILQGERGRIELDFVSGLGKWYDASNDSLVIDEWEGSFDKSYQLEMDQFIEFVSTGNLGVAASGLQGADIVQICKTVMEG